MGHMCAAPAASHQLVRDHLDAGAEQQQRPHRGQPGHRLGGSGLAPQVVHCRIMSDLIIAGRCWSVVMEWQTRIVVDPNVLVGKPVIKGTRLAVEFIIDLLAQGWTESDILSNYPGLTREDILACLAYASARLHDERVFPR